MDFAKREWKAILWKNDECHLPEMDNGKKLLVQRHGHTEYIIAEFCSNPMYGFAWGAEDGFYPVEEYDLWKQIDL
jgi:hypothetical protein